MVNINMNRGHGYIHMVTYKNILSIEQLESLILDTLHIYPAVKLLRTATQKQILIFKMAFFFSNTGNKIFQN